MYHIKPHVVVGLCALMGAVSLPTLVCAQSVGKTATINGGGSTLLGPYWIQIAHCYAANNTSYYKPGTVTPTFAPKVTLVTPATPSCTPKASSNGKYGIGYDATGSGAGQAGFFAHSAVPGTPFSPNDNTGVLTSSSTILFGTSDAAGSATAEVFPSLQYGLSDNSLVDSDLGVYNVGTGQPYAPPHSRPSITTAAAYQGLSFVPGNTSHAVGTSAYPVPQSLYGAPIQIPVSVDPIVLAYNSTYKAGFTLQVNPSLTPAGLHLDAQAYCKILSGQITDWGDVSLTTLNGGTSLKDPSDTDAAPITLVGRLDSSGTTSILTRHLAAVCKPYTTGFGTAGTTKITNLPASISSNFTLVSGSGGVASSINGTPGAIGYLGADYAAPYSSAAGTNAFNLPTAVLKNAKNSFRAGTPANAVAAFGAIPAPQSDTKGNYAPTVTSNGYRDDPTAWVQSTSATAPLANPQATTAYPIVGTTNFLGYTCYANSKQVTLITKFLTLVFGSTGDSTLNNVGLSSMPGAYKTAVKNTFLTGTKAKDGSAALNLFFDTAGSGSDNPTCSSAVGG